MKCIFTGVELDDKTTREHVLQCFTGATWMSNKISCSSVQEQFGKGCDVEMEKSFRFVRNLLGAGSGRSTSMRGYAMTSESGHQFLLKGGEFILSKPYVSKVEKLPDGMSKVTAVLGAENQDGWAKRMALDEAGANKVVSMEMHAARSDIADEGMLRAERVVLGGIGNLKGCLKSCYNLLGVKRHDLALDKQFDPLRKCLVNEPLEEPGSIDCFCRLVSEDRDIVLPRFDEFDHTLSVFSNGRGVYGFLQLYGFFDFSMRLSDAYDGDPFQYVYKVDPLQSHFGKEHEWTIDASLLPKFENQDGRMTTASFNHSIKSLERFCDAYWRRSVVDEVMNRVRKRHEGEAFVDGRVVSGEIERELRNVLAPMMRMRQDADTNK